MSTVSGTSLPAKGMCLSWCLEASCTSLASIFPLPPFNPLRVSVTVFSAHRRGLWQGYKDFPASGAVLHLAVGCVETGNVSDTQPYFILPLYLFIHNILSQMPCSTKLVEMGL